MISEWAIRALLGAVLALIAGGAIRLLWRTTPDKPASCLDFSGGEFEPHFEPIRHSQFVQSNDQGNFGELLTAMMMTADGWWQINGKVSGPRGIDGIFLRRDDAGWRACLIETKTNSSPYKNRQMDDEKLLDDLEILFLTAPAHLSPVYGALYRALEAKNGAVTKRLWRHLLASGETQALRIGSDGATTTEADAPSAPAMMQALFQGLRDFDRTRASIQT